MRQVRIPRSIQRTATRPLDSDTDQSLLTPTGRPLPGSPAHQRSIATPAGGARLTRQVEQCLFRPSLVEDLPLVSAHTRCASYQA